MRAERIETLDWLRGLMALSIMLYHLTYWILTPLDSSSVLGRLGIYGVSIFFILSGLSMVIVYNNYITSVKTSIKFFVRRVFRIWPLLWIVCLLIIFSPILNNQEYSMKIIIYNLTTLFGFIAPTKYIATGAWSIGNEMVYYALTPLIIGLYNYKLWLGNILFVITLLIGLSFSFYYLNNENNLSSQWSTYVNPFNNFFLYVGGIAMFYNFNKNNIKPFFLYPILIVSILLFSFLPFNGNQINIVTGYGRVIFLILSFIIVFCFYKMKMNIFPNQIKYLLETFGLATYGIYLIHPLIFGYMNNLFSNNHLILFVSTVVVTIVISIYSYRLFESKFIVYGKILTNKFK